MNWRDDEGVTPVIGTIMIMGIMVIGIGGILLWGGPAIQAIQDQGSLAAMEGELSTVRESTLVLREIDSSRVPIIQIKDGELGIEQGTRFAIHVATKDAFTANCDPHLTSGWTQGEAQPLVFDATGCWDTGGTYELVVEELVGGLPSTKTPALVNPVGETFEITDGSLDFTASSWRFTLQDLADPPVVWAQVYVLETLRFHWELNTDASNYELFLEGGALYRAEGEQLFQMTPAPIQEDIFGTGEYLFRVPTYTGSLIAYGAPNTLHAQVQLLNNHALGNLDATSLRYDFDGSLAEAWCNSLLLRNQTTQAGVYDQAPGWTCASGNANGIRSVTFTPTLDPPATSFPFELIQSRVYANLFL